MLSLIIANDFLILTMTCGCFFSLCIGSPTQKDIPPFLQFDISIQAPCCLDYYSWGAYLFIPFFFLFQQRHILHQALLGYMVRWVFPLASFVTDHLSASVVVKTQPLYTPLAKHRIRRIMALTDFHHWSAVYHSCGKSLLTQFGHVNCKMWCQMMLDREQGVD